MVTAEWKKSVSHKRRNKRFWMFFCGKTTLYRAQIKKKNKKKTPVKSAGRDIWWRRWMWLFSLQTAGGTSTKTVLEKVLQGGCFCASNKFCDGKMNESLRGFSAASTQLWTKLYSPSPGSSKAEGDWSDGSSQQCEASQRWPVICCHLFKGNAADWISGWTLGWVHKGDFFFFWPKHNWDVMKLNKDERKRKQTECKQEVHKDTFRYLQVCITRKNRGW